MMFMEPFNWNMVRSCTSKPLLEVSKRCSLKIIVTNNLNLKGNALLRDTAHSSLVSQINIVSGTIYRPSHLLVSFAPYCKRPTTGWWKVLESPCGAHRHYFSGEEKQTRQHSGVYL